MSNYTTTPFSGSTLADSFGQTTWQVIIRRSKWPAGLDKILERHALEGLGPMMNATWQEWGFPCLPLQPIRKKTGYSILQLLTMVKKKWSHIITHTLCICRCVCVFNLLPLQGQIAGFQPGRGLYLENSWNILESKPNVGQFNILYVTSFKIL